MVFILVNQKAIYFLKAADILEERQKEVPRILTEVKIGIFLSGGEK